MAGRASPAMFAGVLAEHQLDPVPAQGLPEALAERRGLAGQQVAGALD
ncbi:MAG TPA: hypothetical protein VGD91_12475 [Trebonia sp.]